MLPIFEIPLEVLAISHMDFRPEVWKEVAYHLFQNGQFMVAERSIHG
jgi:hypothetical protein